jgi:hypothetical protein
VRRVAAGEATKFDGLLHKGLPLRVLSDNDLILKDGGYDTDDNMYGRPMNFYDTEGDEGGEGEQRADQGEGGLSEDDHAIWSALTDAQIELDKLGTEKAGMAFDMITEMKEKLDMGAGQGGGVGF